MAIEAFITQYIATAGFVYTGERITRKIKEKYLEAVLRQNMAIFDEHGAGEIINQLGADTNLIQTGISQKLALTLFHLGVLLSTYIISFAFHWKLTLILIWPVPLGVILMLAGNMIAVKYGEKALDAYSIGGEIAEEAFGSIKNTIALGIQKYIVDRYRHHLASAEKSGFLLNSFIQCLTAFAIGACWLNVALSFWQGSHFIVDGSASFAAVITITLSTKTAAFSVLGIGGHIKAFTTAVASATKIFSIIERTSPIDPTTKEGLRPNTVTGLLEFQNIKHIYPSRPNAVVMEGLDLAFPPGKTTAVVGSSGSGKSTIIHLIERFYLPVHGDILLDGINIQSLNLRWWRRQIRLISQEPVLFNISIAENIEQGLIGTEFEEASAEEKRNIIVSAAKQACAHNFVAKLSDGYETIVGARGSQLSGGQRQRIAIARALAANPKILLLDEATSALDRTTEAAVQRALNASSANRTTIVVAHRLSTVKDADNIVLLDKGKIVEQGTHDELMRKENAYYRLVEAQANEPKNKNVTEQDDDVSDISDSRPSLDALKKETNVYVEESAVDDSLRYKLWPLVKFAVAFNKDETLAIIIGLTCAIIGGLEEPAAAILTGKAIISISLPLSEGGRILSRAGFWALMFLVLAIVQWIAFTIQGICFAYCSERLVYRARDSALWSILNQDAAFFDRKENSAGTLTSFLSNEATQLASISGATAGTILCAISTLISAFIVGCIFGWKLALVCSSVVPIVVGCGFLAVWFVGQMEEKMESINMAATSNASEAVSSIQSVAALTREDETLFNFQQHLASAGKESLRSNFKRSAVWALSQSVFYACMALGFWYGEVLTLSGEYSLLQFLIVFNTIIMSALSAGLVFEFTPEIANAKKSAANLKRILETKPVVDPRLPDGAVPAEVKGKLDFKNVCFRYPSRAQQVLNDISFTVLPGQHIALVGETGCGKSTIFSLLERFYEPSHGDILVDDHPISSLNVATHRRSIGLVSQDPTLYSGTISENLRIGLGDQEVSEADIESACRDANIYDLILSLP